MSDATALPLQVSDNAIKRVAEIVATEADGTFLRVGVEGGGCSGFQYTYELSQETRDDDVTLVEAPARIVLDGMAVPFVSGSKLDFKVDLMGAAFHIENPNATAACGCGTSFSI